MESGSLFPGSVKGQSSVKGPSRSKEEGRPLVYMY